MKQANAQVSKRRCLNGRQHLWTEVLAYRTHVVKECDRCHTKNWQINRNDKGH